MTSTQPNTTTSLRPAEGLFHLVVAALAPIFLAAAGGDPAQARRAAAETIRAHAARDHLDALPIAQLIVLGLGVISSVSLSMADNLPLPMILKLRGNAASLNRAAEQCRRTLQTERAPPPPSPEIDPEAERRHEQATLASIAQVEQRLAELQASFQAPQPTAPTETAPAQPATAQPAPAQPTPLQPAPAEPASAEATPAPLAPPPTPVQHPPATPLPPRSALMTDAEYHRTIWAAGMQNVARAATADLDALCPAKRRAATMRAEVLSTVAHQLLGIQPNPQPAFRLTDTPPAKP